LKGVKSEIMSTLDVFIEKGKFACQEARQAAPAAAPPETLESFVLRETGVDTSSK
jgi:hypothetical protein